MAKVDAEISYSSDVDILTFWRGFPSKVSVEIGDFIIDVDSRGLISGMEILNASENLDISPEVLEQLSQASMSVVYKPGYVYVVLGVRLSGRDKEISIPLTIDLGHTNVEKERVVFSRR